MVRSDMVAKGRAGQVLRNRNSTVLCRKGVELRKEAPTGASVIMIYGGTVSPELSSGCDWAAVDSVTVVAKGAV